MEGMEIGGGSLIEATRVQGTAVFNPEGEKLGSIDDVMIDKRSGVAAYAILSFGGFLGLGTDHYPIPWAKLKYSPQVGGYVVDMNSKQLEGAPAFADGMEPQWGDQAYEKRLHTYYGVPPYWGEAQ